MREHGCVCVCGRATCVCVCVCQCLHSVNCALRTPNAHENTRTTSHTSSSRSTYAVYASLRRRLLIFIAFMPPATICPIFRVHFIYILNKLASSLHPSRCILRCVPGRVAFVHPRCEICAHTDTPHTAHTLHTFFVQSRKLVKRTRSSCMLMELLNVDSG